MQYEEWKPIYEAILTDFGYDRKGDANARDRLAELVAEGEPLSLGDIELGGTVGICGGAPTLATELENIRGADRVVAASNAAAVCLDHGIEVDCMVTDLDKTPETVRTLTKREIPVAVHAHGDNVPLLERHVPTFDIESVLPTTQTEPTPPMVNFGGFTDGDRAAFLADSCGADRLLFAGWAFDDPTITPEKSKKLRWAERLLRWLERRRSERFAILDGRRDEIDPPR